MAQANADGGVASAVGGLCRACGTAGRAVEDADFGRQQNGPGTVTVQQTPDAGPKAANSNITNEPPALPVDQIIQKFAAREAEFKKERDNYTYTQTFVIQTIDFDDRPDGEYQHDAATSCSPRTESATKK